MVESVKYQFEFISNYDGVTQYRVWRNGRDDGRIYSARNQLYYCDGSAVTLHECAAFNEWKRDEHSRAAAKFGIDAIGQFVEWTPRETESAA